MIKVGLIGTGYIGNLHARSYAKLPNVSVVSVCDKLAESARQLAVFCNAVAYDNLKDMISDGIDVLDVCLPTYLHFSAVEAALLAGVPVLCEKPMALNEKDAQAMEQLSVEKKVPLMIGHTLRFDSHYGVLKQCILSKRFGHIKYARFYRHSPIPLWSIDQWIVNKKLSGGIATDLHIHDTDVVCWLLGQPIWAFTRGDDTQLISILGYEHVNVWAEASWRSQKGFTFESGFDVVFDKATLRFDGNSLLYVCDSETRPINPFEFEVDSSIYIYDDPLTNEIAYFLRCIQNNEPFENCTTESSRISLQIVCVERRSLETGSIVQTA
jgi:predicted dehydrogenase